MTLRKKRTREIINAKRRKLDYHSSQSEMEEKKEETNDLYFTQKYDKDHAAFAQEIENLCPELNSLTSRDETELMVYSDQLYRV